MPDASPPDPRFQRDPEFIRQVLPVLERALHWYAPEIRGLDRLPATDPFLIVGNHSGGPMMPDMWIFYAAWTRQHGIEREAYGLGFDLLFAAPGLSSVWRKFGTIPASMDNADAALDRGAPVLVYPGGDWEACRPFSHRHRIDFHGHTGFVKLALRRQIPVVPLVSHGSHESLVIVTRGERIASLLQLNRLRIKVFPIVLGVPFGLTTILGPYLPLPTQVTVEVLEPLDWTHYGPDAADDPEIVQRCYDEITGLMQAELDELAATHRFAVLRRFKNA